MSTVKTTIALFLGFIFFLGLVACGPKPATQPSALEERVSSLETKANNAIEENSKLRLKITGLEQRLDALDAKAAEMQASASTPNQIPLEYSVQSTIDGKDIDLTGMFDVVFTQSEHSLCKKDNSGCFWRLVEAGSGAAGVLNPDGKKEIPFRLVSQGQVTEKFFSTTDGEQVFDIIANLSALGGTTDVTVGTITVEKKGVVFVSKTNLNTVKISGLNIDLGQLNATSTFEFDSAGRGISWTEIRNSTGESTTITRK